MPAYYFASRYSRHEELRGYRKQLLDTVPGALVTSRWIDLHTERGVRDSSFGPEALNGDPEMCWPYGADDLEDLIDSDVLISFTGSGGKGGRHVEHGAALILHGVRKLHGVRFRIIIVGARENVFHCHPDTEVYENWDKFLAMEMSRHE